MTSPLLIAFDLDGTLSQHRSHPSPEVYSMLDALSARYSLIMVGAGAARRIYEQLEHYPIDVIGNYGMQYCRYDPEMNDISVVFDEHADCDRESVSARIAALREQFGYTEFTGNGVEFHDSGCVTFPLLGTKAAIADKLAFDPDRSKRAVMYETVKSAFPEFTVFIGGSSSFDFAPHPYDKYFALDRLCRDRGLSHDAVVYVGDDFGPGGNDEAVFRSDFRFIQIDDFRRTPEIMKQFLE